MFHFLVYHPPLIFDNKSHLPFNITITITSTQPFNTTRLFDTVTMLANKENVLVHGPSHGAGKINPKTPGPARLNPKTPFKVTLNDDKFKIGKNDLFTGNDPSMFVTPAGMLSISNVLVPDTTCRS